MATATCCNVRSISSTVISLPPSALRPGQSSKLSVRTPPTLSVCDFQRRDEWQARSLRPLNINYRRSNSQCCNTILLLRLHFEKETGNGKDIRIWHFEMAGLPLNEPDACRRRRMAQHFGLRPQRRGLKTQKR